jgi:hypothetical protein
MKPILTEVMNEWTRTIGLCWTSTVPSHGLILRPSKSENGTVIKGT